MLDLGSGSDLDMSSIAPDALDFNFGESLDLGDLFNFDSSPMNFGGSFPSLVTNTTALNTAANDVGPFDAIFSTLGNAGRTLVDSIAKVAPGYVASALSHSGTFGKKVVNQAASTKVNAGVSAFFSNPIVWIVLAVAAFLILFLRR